MSSLAIFSLQRSREEEDDTEVAIETVTEVATEISIANFPLLRSREDKASSRWQSRWRRLLRNLINQTDGTFHFVIFESESLSSVSDCEVSSFVLKSIVIL
jgi:hypothetical protein